MDYAKNRGKECLNFKVDFENTYDSINCGFLDYMLMRFGFNDRWQVWIRACVVLVVSRFWLMGVLLKRLVSFGV